MNSHTATSYTRETAPDVYEWTGPTGVKFRDVKQPSGTYYHDTTPPEVIRWLESVRVSGQRIRMVYGDRETGKDWLCENDKTGRVGRTTGWHTIPILCSNRRSSGGGAILADCIVRLFVNGCEVYRHPLYKVPEIEVWFENQHAECPWAANVNGDKTHARFKTEKAALRWKDFMQGKRMGR